MQLNTVMLVGAPNVGKSMIFNYLTGMYVAVSNYPGTTVEISQGNMQGTGTAYRVVDTPGMYSMIPMTEEERVTRELLCDNSPKLVIHVIDAKHIRRMLMLTLELLDGEFPLIVCLNVMDEAERIGIRIDSAALSQSLGVPVVKTSAVNRGGLEQLRQEILHYRFREDYPAPFDEQIEEAIDGISNVLQNDKRYGMSKRLCSILLLQGDKEIWHTLRQDPRYEELVQHVNQATGLFSNRLDFILSGQRQETVNQLLSAGVVTTRLSSKQAGEIVGRLTREPITGIPILFLVLYVGLYLFVGRFGAGFLVDYLDHTIFGGYLLPFIGSWVEANIPGEPLRQLLIGEFGVLSLGLRYAVAIILPVVGAFFFSFALLEDSGYLPRLAMLLNELCRWFGLNGRAVIPLSLGLGCGTMAVMVTRTLETNRERVLATFLLSLAVPCSAQLGVIIALLSSHAVALLLWGCILFACFIIAGLLANGLLPGQCSLFYMELPPIRLPRLDNVLLKAYSRMVWYMREIIPVFVGVSVSLWFAQQMGWLEALAGALRPVLQQIGLPNELAMVFLLGFFRRDYGAAGLYDLSANGTLSPKELLVSAVALTLFLPCIAQLIVMIKERGIIVSILMIMLIVGLSISVAWLVQLLVNPAWLL